MIVDAVPAGPCKSMVQTNVGACVTAQGKRPVSLFQLIEMHDFCSGACVEYGFEKCRGMHARGRQMARLLISADKMQDL